VCTAYDAENDVCRSIYVSERRYEVCANLRLFQTFI